MKGHSIWQAIFLFFRVNVIAIADCHYLQIRVSPKCRFLGMNLLDVSFSTKSLECPVCKEILSDPRILPCGHVYCGGLSNNCIGSLRVEANNDSSSSFNYNSGRFKCALCNVIHSINVISLPPIYGIRDFLELAKKHAKKPRLLNF